MFLDPQFFTGLKNTSMASNLLKLHLQISKTPSTFPTHHRHRLSYLPYFISNVPQKPNFSSLSLHASLSSPPSPPTSKEEAILQAKTCLSSSLKKPLNNPKLAAGKLKKLKQCRFQVEIPLIDDSPSSLSQLALDIFKDLPLKSKASLVKFLILWPDASFKEAGILAFESLMLNHVEHIDLTSVTNSPNRISSSAEMAVFLAPEASQLEIIRMIAESLYPKPVVIINPRWSSEEKNNFGAMKAFVGSFEVIYSFMGLEVRGILSKRKGVVFKCVRDGVLGGERWEVHVEEDGELKVVSRFKARPSIEEVETVLYNLMAINSPITRSAKFLRELVNNVYGKK
ncbi:hypothetical protein SLE2022_395440 [Rubroshorea leprosula]